MMATAFMVGLSSRAATINVNSISDFPVSLVSGNTYILQTDLVLPDRRWVSGDVTVDLNGHVIDRGLSVETSSGLSFYINSGSLTIIDSNPSSEHTGTLAAYTGGIITGGYNRDSSPGGAIRVQSGTLYLQGGTITGNRCQRGAGVYVEGAMVMTGGKICGNTATNSVYGGGNGGGVMLGYNTSTSGATFTMAGGEISGNIGGGVITHNNSTYPPIVNIGGTAKIYGNTLEDGSTKCNLYLQTGINVNITSALESGANIWVSRKAGAGTFTSGYATYNSGDAPSTYFSSDNASYEVSLTDGGEAQLAVPSIAYASLSGNTLTFRYGPHTLGANEWDVSATGTTTPGWHSSSFDINNVVFDASFAGARPTSCYNWFSEMVYLTNITGLEYLNTSEVTNMTGMFYYCESLTSVDVSHFKTDKVTNFTLMFAYCSSLKELNISSFQTSQVDNGNRLESMFAECPSLRYVDMVEMTDVHDAFTGSSPYTISGTTLFYMPKNKSRSALNFINTTDGITFTCSNYFLSDKDDIVIPYPFTATNITYNRSFTADQKQTVCLPFAISTTGKGTFYEYDNYNSSTGKVQFTEVSGTSTTANTPYLFVPSSTGTLTLGGGEVSATTATEDPASASDGFHGVTTKVTFAANQSDIYGWASNAFKKAGNGSSFSAGRAYLKLSTAFASEMLDVDFGDGNVTGIDNIELINSKGNAPAYNLNGQRVSTTYQGIVIKNGKKQLVK